MLINSKMVTRKIVISSSPIHKLESECKEIKICHILKKKICHKFFLNVSNLAVISISHQYEVFY